MILGKLRLPSTRTPHARKAVAVSVACLVLAAIGCETSRRTTPTTFTTNPTSSDETSKQIRRLQTTQNPVPIDPTIHVYGPNNTYAFGQQFVPTSVIDPKQRGDLQRGSDSGPRGIVAAPIDLVASDGTSSASVQLTWTASTTPGVSYQVLRGESPSTLQNLGRATTTAYTDSTAEPGKIYYYAVQALAFGQPSDNSNIAQGQRNGDGDGDGDGIGVGDDGFPNDPLRTASGVYGCGVADADSDNGTAVEVLVDSSTYFDQVCASSQNTVSATTNTSTSTTSSQVKP